MIKVGDRVKVKNTGAYASELTVLIGTVERISRSIMSDIAIVDYGRNGKAKILVEDLTVCDKSVTLTRDRFNELKHQVIDRDSFDKEDERYQVINICGNLILDRLELLLFEEANNG